MAFDEAKTIHQMLVKLLHPDGAAPAEQARRTRLMQRVNAAYETNDLDTLKGIAAEVLEGSPPPSQPQNEIVREAAPKRASPTPAQPTVAQNQTPREPPTHKRQAGRQFVDVDTDRPFRSAGYLNVEPPDKEAIAKLERDRNRDSYKILSRRNFRSYMERNGNQSPNPVKRTCKNLLIGALYFVGYRLDT